MEDVIIQFQGFRPSRFTREFLDGKFNELHERSPYGSTLKAVFVREANELKATIRIMSSGGEFFAVAKGRRLRNVSKNLFNQMNKQLQKWKAIRHGGGNHDRDVA